MNRLDTLGAQLGHAALTTLVRLYPDIRCASEAQLEAACAAMRARSPEVVNALLADAKAVPHLSEVVFATAVLSLAHEGIRALQATRD